MGSCGVPDPDNVPGHTVNGQLLDMVNVTHRVKGKRREMMRMLKLMSIKGSLIVILRAL